MATADTDFIQVTDAGNRVQCINTRQIVRVGQSGGIWQVLFVAGDAILINESEAEKLFARLPGVNSEDTAG